MSGPKIHLDFVENRLEFIFWSVINFFAWAFLLGGAVLISLYIVVPSLRPIRLFALIDHYGPYLLGACVLAFIAIGVDAAIYNSRWRD